MIEKIQKAIKVNDEASFKNLNDHLEGGWKVVDSVSMPSYQVVSSPTCLVIIEVKILE